MRTSRKILLLQATLLLAALPLTVARADDESVLSEFEETGTDYIAASYDETAPGQVFHNHQGQQFSLRHQDAGHKRRSLADKHAPAGLMGAHLHEPGELMVEYKYMNMYMDGNRVGTRRVSTAEALGAGPPMPGITVDGIRTNAGATPTDMNMEMHMFHFMYGLTDNVTVYTMLNLPSLTMDHVRGNGNMAGPGTPFTTTNSGLGDTGIGALVSLYEDEDDDLMLNLGASLPTGDIFRETAVPTAGVMDQALPYPMRLGSGTFNAKPGVTWRHYYDCSSFGLQFQTDIPVGRNYRGYSVSDTYTINGWYSYLLTKNISVNARLENVWKTNFDGTDPSSPNAIISTNVEQFRGGYWLNLGLGGAVLVGGHLFNFEAVPNIYQDLNGIQLETDWTFVASWSTTFK